MSNNTLLSMLKLVAKGQKQTNGKESGISTLLLSAAKEIEILDLALRKTCDMYFTADEWQGQARKAGIQRAYDYRRGCAESELKAKNEP